MILASVTSYEFSLWMEYFCQDTLSHILLLAKATCLIFVAMNMHSRLSRQVHVNVHEPILLAIKKTQTPTLYTVLFQVE